MAKKKATSKYGTKGQVYTYKQHQALKRKAMQKKDRWMD